MIKIVSVSVQGITVNQEFEGRIEFAQGLQIYSAGNGFGKSSLYSCIIWALGLEALYVSKNNDPSSLPEALRTRISFGDEQYEDVLSCNVTAEFENSEGQKIRVNRKTDTESASRPEVTILSKDKNETRKLVNGYGSRDEVTGFQSFLLKFAGISTPKLLTYQAEERPIYFENLAPLFLIDQLEGWANIQAQQVTRYGLLEVYQAAVETILGLNDRLERRLQVQKSENEVSSLKASLREQFDKINKITLRAGYEKEKSVGNRKIVDLLEDMKNFSLDKYLANTINFRFQDEKQNLKRSIQDKTTALANLEIPQQKREITSDVSSKVIGLQKSIHENNSRLSSLLSQVRNQEVMLETIKSREHSSQDLLKLKRDGVGFPEMLSCPTCQSDVQPNNFNLVAQDIESIESYIGSLGKEKQLISQNIHQSNIDIMRLKMWIDDAAKTLRISERELENLTNASTLDRRSIVQLTSEISALESKLERLDLLNEELLLIQKSLDEWKSRAEVFVKIESEGLGPRPKEVDEFEKLFRKHLFILKHSSLNQRQEDIRVYLDGDYNPMFEGRRLRTLGSASDQARLVLAYVTALTLQSIQPGGNHPGILVLDEPYQQNPDDFHKLHLAEFFKYFSSAIGKHQTIIFTSLPIDDRRKLKKENMNVFDLEGEHFLKPVVSPAPPGEVKS